MAVRFVLSIAGIFYRALQLLPFANKIVSLNTLSCRKCTTLTIKWYLFVALDNKIGALNNLGALLLQNNL